MKKIVVFILVLLLIVAGLTWYYLKNKDNHRLIASGTIEATEVVISSKTIGRVLAVNAAEGDKVLAGKLLVQVEAKEAAAALKSAEARYKIAHDDVLRSKKLFADKMISPQQYEQVVSAQDIAEAALELARIQYDNTMIKAPISGTVLVKAIEPGELASIGTPLITLADLSEVTLTVYLAEKDIGKVRLGEEVAVSVDSFPNEKFKGRVTFISEKAEFTPKAIQTKDERVTQVFGIKIKIPNQEMKLKPGMPADAQFQWNQQ